MRFCIFASASVALLLCLVVLPEAAHAAIPFFGPIIPDANNTCAAGWGMLIVVINNIEQLIITLLIVFVAPLMLAYAGFLYVVNPVSPEGRSKANRVLRNTIVGIVVALAAWLIIDAIMVALTNQGVGAWTNLISGDGAAQCLEQSASFNQTSGGQNITGYDVSGQPYTQPDNSFGYQSGIAAETSAASVALSQLISCMAATVPGNVGQISSISDTYITSGQKTWAQCRQGQCQHAANSCHYGGTSCGDQSYAVDFGDEQDAQILTNAANQCSSGKAWTSYEGNHLHVSIGEANGCNCN